MYFKIAFMMLILSSHIRICNRLQWSVKLKHINTVWWVICVSDWYFVALKCCFVWHLYGITNIRWNDTLIKKIIFDWWVPGCQYNFPFRKCVQMYWKWCWIWFDDSCEDPQYYNITSARFEVWTNIIAIISYGKISII